MNRIKSLASAAAHAVVFDVIALYGAYNRRRYLAKSAKATKQSEKLLRKLVRKSRNTEFGKKYHFDEIHSVEDYRRLVPFTDYSFY